jgi:Putative restriction endonuclease
MTTRGQPMATATEASAAIPAEAKIPPADLYRMSVREYEKIGPLLDTEKVELINGLVVNKMPQSPPHCVTDDLCRAALAAVIPAGWYIRSNKPVRLTSVASEPEPDQAVVRGKIRDYLERSPGPKDIRLIVEIAESPFDKEGRAWIYGASGIPVYWLLNIPGQELSVFFDPTTNGYASKTVWKPGQTIGLWIDDVLVGEIPIRDLFP